MNAIVGDEAAAEVASAVDAVAEEKCIPALGARTQVAACPGGCLGLQIDPLDRPAWMVLKNAQADGARTHRRSAMLRI